MKKINSVQLQRETRGKAYQKNKGKSLTEEVEVVRQSLKKKGLDRLFKAVSPTREK